MAQLRLAAALSARIAAIVSVILTVRAGRHSHSVVLIALMAMWVLAPFVALLWAIQISQRWQEVSRSVLYRLTLLIAAGALAAYTIDALGPPRAKAATVFVVVPLVSWILSGIALVVTRLRR